MTKKSGRFCQLSRAAAPRALAVRDGDTYPWRAPSWTASHRSPCGPSKSSTVSRRKRARRPCSSSSALHWTTDLHDLCLIGCRASPGTCGSPRCARLSRGHTYTNVEEDLIALVPATCRRGVFTLWACEIGTDSDNKPVSGARDSSSCAIHPSPRHLLSRVFFSDSCRIR